MRRYPLAKNPLLKYSTERLLNIANPKGKYYFKKTTLNKMLYLLYLSLKERDIDIKFPYFWFKWGTLTDDHSYYEFVGLPFSRYFKSNGYTRAMVRVPHSDIDDSVKTIIDEEILGLLNKYKDSKGIFLPNYLQLILDDVYVTAPYEFQRTFNRGLYKYTEQFKTLKRKKIPSKLRLNPNNVEQIKEYLSKLIIEFPEEDIPELYDLFLEWQDTMQLALIYNHTLSLKLLEDFWDIFARALRIRYYENIPEYVIEDWSKKYREEDYSKFERELDISRNQLLLNYIDYSEPNTTVKDMVNDIMDFAYEKSLTKF